VVFKKVTACGLGPLENSEQASEYKEIQSCKAGTVLLDTRKGLVGCQQ